MTGFKILRLTFPKMGSWLGTFQKYYTRINQILKPPRNFSHQQTVPVLMSISRGKFDLRIYKIFGKIVLRRSAMAAKIPH